MKNLQSDTTELAENLISSSEKELKKIEAKGIDRRQFSRAEVLDKKIEVSFASGGHFAKQYIENISFGGLFVKTEQKAKIGDVLPISFTIPATDPLGKPRVFSLKGRVCRAADNGLGLEFTNLSNEMRKDLEEFVKSILPQGVQISTKAKASTLEKLGDLRAKNSEKSFNRKRHIKQGLLVVALTVINTWMALRTFEQDKIDSRLQGPNPTIIIGNKSFSEKEVRSFQRKANGQWQLNLANGSHVIASSDELEKQLPPHLRRSYELLKNVGVAKSKRVSKNSPQLTRLR